MVYVDAAGRVYLTNGTIIGYLEAVNFQSFPDPEQTYKTPMVHLRVKIAPYAKETGLDMDWLRLRTW